MAEKAKKDIREIVDVDQALGIYGSEEILEKCLQDYAESFFSSFKEVHMAWRSQDIESCKQKSHKFKGGLLYICIFKLLSFIKPYNGICKKKDLKKANELYGPCLYEAKVIDEFLGDYFEMEKHGDEFEEWIDEYETKMGNKKPAASLIIPKPNGLAPKSTKTIRNMNPIISKQYKSNIEVIKEIPESQDTFRSIDNEDAPDSPKLTPVGHNNKKDLELRRQVSIETGANTMTFESSSLTLSSRKVVPRLKIKPSEENLSRGGLHSEEENNRNMFKDDIVPHHPKPELLHKATMESVTNLSLDDNGQAPQTGYGKSQYHRDAVDNDSVMAGEEDKQVDELPVTATDELLYKVTFKRGNTKDSSYTFNPDIQFTPMNANNKRQIQKGCLSVNKEGGFSFGKLGVKESYKQRRNTYAGQEERESVRGAKKRVSVNPRDGRKKVFSSAQLEPKNLIGRQNQPVSLQKIESAKKVEGKIFSSGNSFRGNNSRSPDPKTVSRPVLEAIDRRKSEKVLNLRNTARTGNEGMETKSVVSRVRGDSAMGPQSAYMPSRGTSKRTVGKPRKGKRTDRRGTDSRSAVDESTFREEKIQRRRDYHARVTRFIMEYEGQKPVRKRKKKKQQSDFGKIVQLLRSIFLF